MLLVSLNEAFTRLEWKKGSKELQLKVLEFMHERLPFIVAEKYIKHCRCVSHVKYKIFDFEIFESFDSTDDDKLYVGDNNQNDQITELVNSLEFLSYCKDLIEDIFHEVSEVSLGRVFARDLSKMDGSMAGYYSFSVKCKLLEDDVQISKGEIKRYVTDGLHKGNFIVKNWLQQFVYSDSKHIGSVTVAVIGTFSSLSPNVVGNELENRLHTICENAGIDLVDYKGLGIVDLPVGLGFAKCTKVRIKFDANRLVKQLSGK